MLILKNFKFPLPNFPSEFFTNLCSYLFYEHSNTPDHWVFFFLKYNFFLIIRTMHIYKVTHLLSCLTVSGGPGHRHVWLIGQGGWK